MLKIESLTFTYPGRGEPTLRDVNFMVSRGEFVLVTGPTGCGKSTLLKTLNGLIPHESGGKLKGRIVVDGRDTQKSSLSEITPRVGLVFQSPDDQIFSTRVEDEVAFGPENLCLRREVVEERIRESLDLVGLAGFRERATSTLSGGEKQRLAIASVLAMRPQVLALDEPLSQLDPKGSGEVLNVLTELNKKGVTIILVEHRIPLIFPLINRIVVLNRGRIVLDEEKGRVTKYVTFFKKLGLESPCEPTFSLNSHFLAAEVSKRPEGKVVLKARNVYFRYEKGGNYALKGISLEIKAGEMVAILGNNGSGKSTLLLHFAGILHPKKGKIEILGENSGHTNSLSLAGKVGIVFQNPDLLLFSPTVQREIEFGPRALNSTKERLNEVVSRTMDALTLNDLSGEIPHALSRGQRLRVAVASVVSLMPRVLLLDEPTSGQDRLNILSLMEYLKIMKRKGVTTLFVTHDIRCALNFADRVLVMNGGRIKREGTSPKKEDVF